MRTASHQFHTAITPVDVMQLTRATPDICNNTDKFQDCLEPYFTELQETFLPCLDDFRIFDQTEYTLLCILH